MPIVHATCVALGPHGILIRGESGSGKSDLALRLMDDGAMLVADDHVVIEAEAGALVAQPHETLAGMIEVRGLGIVEVPFLPSVQLALTVTLVAGDAVPRMPEPDSITIAGVALPHLLLAPFEASAVAKLRTAVRAIVR